MMTEHAKKKIAEMLETDTLPQFIILKGDITQKETLIKEATKGYNVNTVSVGNKIEDIRNIINTDSVEIKKNMFIIQDGGNLSRFAVNALLKITEEPKRNTHIVMFIGQEYNVLDTLLSRARLYEVQDFNRKSVKIYIKNKGITLSKQELYVIHCLCENISEVDRALQYELIPLFDYMNKVWRSLGKVSLANALNVANKLSYKVEDTEGYECIFFMQGLKKCIVNCSDVKVQRNKLRLSHIISEHLHLMRMGTGSKRMIVDNCIISLHEELTR